MCFCVHRQKWHDGVGDLRLRRADRCGKRAVSRYLERTAEAHKNAVKCIFKYIRGTIDMGICFESGGNLDFRGYSDADYAGDVITRRSTSGYVFMFGNGIISWCSERQNSVALSTTESEYIAAPHAVKELVWLKGLLSELLLVEINVPIFFMDNQSAIRLVKNPAYHKRTKHIDVRYHFIREKFEDGAFVLNYVPSNEMVADILTKALPKTSIPVCIDGHFAKELNIFCFKKLLNY